MATAANDSTSYGGGAGGKFRKRPFRRPQTTPYDRPPAALRITRRNNDNINTGGWLSRIVDPASKLITAGAHKLFSSVFRKRLLPPPQPSQDEKAVPLENHLEDAMIEAPSSQARDMNKGSSHNNGSMTDEVAELEHILNQKTFTRSEVDRLTVLLHSRSVDKTTAEGQERFELTPSENLAVHSRQKELRGTAFGDGVNPSEVSGRDLTRAVRSNVNVDVASPTELAKAYMGSRSTRVSPPILGSQNQAVGEETPAFTTHKLQRTSVVSTVQKPFSPAGTSHKDFVVPRSRGRSAIYSMARTPYSRVQQTVTKGLGTNNDADGQSLLSSQKVLKRRCSVLENDIGVVGPIRRIRQKTNLLYPKTTGLPSSVTPFTYSTPVVGEASSSKSHEDRGEKCDHSGSFVSSKSTEMGQRILQHLDNLTSPKEKSIEKKPGFSGGISGMKLTPAMLRGQARKSLETVDSLKCVQQDSECEKMVNSSDVLHEVQDITPKEHTKFHDSDSKVLMKSSSSKDYPENGEARSTDANGMVITKNIAPVFIKSAVDVPKRSPAFQMSAYEDFLDMDDDAQLNGAASPATNEDKRYVSASSVQSNGKLPKHSSFAEPAKSHRPFPGMEFSSNSVPKTNTAVESSNIAEKGISSFYTDSGLNKTIGSTPSTSVPHEADIPVSTISSGLKSSDKVPSPSFITSVAQSSVTKDVTSSGFVFADAAIKSPGSNTKSIEGVNLFEQLVKTPTSVSESSTGNFSSLGSFPLASAAPSAVLFSSQSSSGGSSAQSTLTASITGASATKVGTITAATTGINGGSDSLRSSVALPSFQPTFGGSSAISNSATIATLGTGPAGKSEEIALGTTQGSPSASFQFGGPTTSSSGSIFSSQVSASKTATESTAENISNQAAASALPASSGSSSLPMNSGSLTSVSAPLSVASWQPTNEPGSGSAFSSSSSGLSFGTSSAPANGSSAGSSSSVSSSLIFGAAAPSISVSSGLTFGTSSSNGSSNGAPFGASSTSGSMSSIFGFGASSSASSIAPSPSSPFGASSTPASTSAPSSTFSFGLASAAPASSAAPSSTFSFGGSSAQSSTFSFGGSSAASSAAPSSTFSFGASSASASSTAAPSSTFSFGASTASASSSAAPSSTFSFGSSSASASSSASPSSTFSFGASSASASSSAAPSSTFSFGASSASASSSAAPSSTFAFGASSASSSAAPSSTFAFGAAASSSAPSSTFSFGASSAPAASSATPSSTFSFGASSASVSATPAPVFPFGSGTSTPASTIFQPSQTPAFGGTNSSSVFGFGSTPSPTGNNDQMNMEDTMLEDSMQSSTAAFPTPVFGQSPTSNFSFGMAQPQAPAPASLGASPFQFASQQNQVAGAPNPFQASGSFDGGSFSLGAGGNDKSNRRIVKVKSRNRKK